MRCLGLLALTLLLAACSQGGGGRQSVAGPTTVVYCEDEATGNVTITTTVDCGPRDSGNVIDNSKGAK
jgi:hypothetical protein